MNPKVNFFCLKKISIELRAKQTGATHAYHIRDLEMEPLTAKSRGGLEANPEPLGYFVILHKKISISAPFGLNSVPSSMEPFERTNFQDLKAS